MEGSLVPAVVQTSSRLALIVLGGFTLWVLFGFLVHFHEATTKSPERAPKLETYWRAFLGEWWFTLAVFLSYPFGIWPRARTGRYHAGGGPPILLLHGYMMNRSSLFALYWRLRRCGYRNVYPISARPMWAPLVSQARDIAHELRWLHELSGGQKVYAIGHSQGGLVLRLAAVLEPGLPVAKIITLGSPHYGTVLSRFALGENGREMLPDSPLYQRLGNDVPVPLVAMWSDMDNIIIPSEHSRFGDRHVLFPGIGHHVYLYAKGVFAAIVAELPPFEVVTTPSSSR